MAVNVTATRLQEFWASSEYKGGTLLLSNFNDKVPPLYSEEAQNSWSLVAVTLTAVVVALPNIAKDSAKGLLVSMTEGLKIVKHIEESLNVNEELVKARQASRPCFTNLPHVITMKCHHDAIEKRQGSIRTAARILGKSKEILDILKKRQLPNLDMDSMAYLDKWRTLPKSQIPEDSSSLNEFLELTIM
ncbi:hypothetical protein CTI12_AA396100 [Artemisia annua]|uniref:Uncharacterized protein n=1 Tax=Artemisia annua TaxID=35608 RepID=A0A2U1MCA4_ARTAN|nr:hypothetical protein CTI12_AA396100 [Artemisia annua]